MSKEKKKSVQPAETPQPNKAAAEPAVAAPAESKPAAAISQQETAVEVSPFVAKITPQMREKLAEVSQMTGFDLTWLPDFVVANEARWQIVEEDRKKIQEAFQKVGVALDRLAPLGDLIQRQQQGQGQPQTQQQGSGSFGGVNLSDLGNLLKVLGMGGGGGESSMINEKLMALAFENFGLGNALLKAIILKTAPDFADQILKPKAEVSST